MFWEKVVVAHVFCAALCAAQSGPAINDIESGVVTRTKARSLSALDFKELLVRIGSKSYRLHHGSYKHVIPGKGGVIIELENNWLLPPSKGNHGFALIYFVKQSIGGSSSLTAYVQLIAFNHGRLVTQQELSFNPSGEGAGCQFDPAKGELRIVAKSDDPSSDVLPLSQDKALYKWDGKHFQLANWHPEVIAKNRERYSHAP
jgi:hypothetical protein